MNELVVDDLHLTVRWSDRRKTLGLTVDRDGALVLAAPNGASEDALRSFVQEKRFWIYKKLAEKAELRRPLARKEFIDGEGFLYLGRSYRLKLVDEQADPLKLINGRFCLRRELAADGRTQFIKWYSQRGQEWLSKKVASYVPRMEVKPAGVKVQDLGYRWGSCGKGNTVYFNWKTILLPSPIAEYVVAHELVHLHEAHHTPAFWRRLQRVLPDYDQRKQWLAQHGIEVEGL